MTPDPKRPPIRLSPYHYRALRRRVIDDQPCLACGGNPIVMSAHHLVGGTWREDVEENLIPLGGSGTVYCHGIYTSRNPGLNCNGDRRRWIEVASSIREGLTEARLDYIRETKGEDWLRARYPTKEEIPPC